MASISALGAMGLGLAGSLYSPRIWAEPAAATEPNPTLTANAQTPTAAKGEELVVLRDGTRYRGTIVEAVANDHILIQIVGGTVREAPMSEVVYAGPVQEAPASGPIKGVMPAPTTPANVSPTDETRAPRLGEVVVHFQTHTPALTVWMESIDTPTGGGMVRLCEAPCSRPVPAGSYRVSYSVGDGKPREASSTLNLDRETWLQGDLESKRGNRVFGFVTLGIGGAVGMILMSSAATISTVEPERATNRALIGAASMAGGLVLGLPFGLMGDTAVVIELPRPETASNVASFRHRDFSGLALRGSF